MVTSLSIKEPKKPKEREPGEFEKEALALVRLGFYIFPLQAGSKLPAVKDFKGWATREKKKIRDWWIKQPYSNIGISTSNFSDDKMSLLVLDVDNKDKRGGSNTIAALKEVGNIFPETIYQTTPNLGYHRIYFTEEPLRQGVNVLGPGVDTRAQGGYIVGSGSVIKKRKYKMTIKKIAEVPDWIIEECNKAHTAVPNVEIPVEVNEETLNV